MDCYKGGIKMKTHKVAVKKASDGGWKVRYTKDLNGFIKNMLNEYKTIVLNIDPQALDFYPPNEKVDLAIVIADFYLG